MTPDPHERHIPDYRPRESPTWDSRFVGTLLSAFATCLTLVSTPIFIRFMIPKRTVQKLMSESHLGMWLLLVPCSLSLIVSVSALRYVLRRKQSAALALTATIVAGLSFLLYAACIILFSLGGPLQQ